ncbi:DUF1039 domain-containing protein [Enterobacteriaceae bacterium H20N1]|uniref:DUF1039 domain-containing protein n=1 Tax=Dryocola boscaweniae TaxID=2925397 RepID=A0A9X2W4P1_9ENTR|nr:DUF1039 domain-containing protein [Dryocola boscaweniae]MCT4700517.1 DUF1039 domain-containing protein [Dryocola boscaweniae]MCT4717673.1 DUF1039 domain-containing protein [Dryocola boscaweniae]
MILSRSLRRLLVMSALAAANHRLVHQAREIQDAFPLLIEDAHLRQQCHAAMLALLDNANLTSASYSPMSEVARALTESGVGQ